MPDRTRPIRKEICLNETELNLIQHKMRQLGTHNFGAYARKMLMDGYIIKVDYTEQKKLAAAVNRITDLPPHQQHGTLLRDRRCRPERPARRRVGAAESTAEGGAVTITGFSVAGFSDGGQADAPEGSGIGFQDAGFRDVHRG